MAHVKGFELADAWDEQTGEKSVGRQDQKLVVVKGKILGDIMALKQECRQVGWMDEKMVGRKDVKKVVSMVLNMAAYQACEMVVMTVDW